MIVQRFLQCVDAETRLLDEHTLHYPVERLDRRLGFDVRTDARGHWSHHLRCIPLGVAGGVETGWGRELVSNWLAFVVDTEEDKGCS